MSTFDLPTETAPPATPSVTKVYVVGHTFCSGVSIPVHRGLANHKYETMTVASLGAKMVYEMISRSNQQLLWGLQSFETPIESRNLARRRQAWRMHWHPRPPREDEEVKQPTEATLRIGAIQSVEFLPPYQGNLVPLWIPLSLSNPPAGANVTGAAMYICFDVSVAFEPTTFPSALDTLIPGTPKIVLLHLTASKPVDDFRVIQALLTKLKDVAQLVVVVGDRCLQHLKLSINDDNSWEAFADSLLDLRLWERENLGFKELKNCDLIVRHSAYSAIRMTRKNPAAELHFVVDAKHSLKALPGFLRGHNAILGASLLLNLINGPASTHNNRLQDGIVEGLRRCMKFEKAGFCVDLQADLQSPVTLFRDAPDSTTIRSITIPEKGNPIRAKKKWSILDLIVCGNLPETPRDHAYRIGKSIVQDGLRKAIEEHQFPVVRFGKLTIIDRIAFEQLREIQATMRNYLAAFLHKKMPPLCLGVFGAPGGGKSFGVKQLAQSLNSEHLAREPLEVNVSQLSGPDDLQWVFRQIRDTTLEGKVPLVLFDEFDTPRGVPFGWLQTFLAPMQDGRFGTQPNSIEFRHGIFIFIGGVNHNFAMFNGRSRDREFIAAKGPDFVSRLSRYLNVLGISRESEDDHTYLIRRAVLIRDTLAQYHKTLFENDAFDNDSKGKARIDDEVVRKLLLIKAFRHGIRSLEAIIRTSRLSPDQPCFHIGSLPPDWQLDMHLDLAEYQQL